MVNRNKNLENRLGKNNWAYTGSLAMKIHANRLGVPFPMNRKIGNINIAAKNPLNLVPVIASTKRWKLKHSPNPRHTVFHNNYGLKLNLFPANGRLAPNFRHVQILNGIPLMSLRSLRNQKQMTKNNAMNRNKNKIHKNIEFLNLLLKSNTRRSPVRAQSRSPPKRRLNSAHSFNNTKRKLSFF
jgi:hypothetical protein